MRAEENKMNNLSAAFGGLIGLIVWSCVGERGRAGASSRDWLPRDKSPNRLD